MQVKELYKKYKGYEIILYGKNKSWNLKECIKKATPFSFIYTTNQKEIDNMYVMDILIKEEEKEITSFDKSLNYVGRYKCLGIVYAYVGKEKIDD